jgi:RNA polymerase sigma factor (TIGR02999 family)
MNDVTRILTVMESGDGQAARELLPLVYEELKRLAAQQMAREDATATLQTTALVHEAYIRLVGKDDPKWQGRRHFFAAAAQAMRRILVDHARRKHAARHGGGRERVELEADLLPADSIPTDILGLDEALKELAETDPEKARLVELRYFAGLSIEEAAAGLEISRATAVRHWTYARAWLLERMTREKS